MGNPTRDVVADGCVRSTSCDALSGLGITWRLYYQGVALGLSILAFQAAAPTRQVASSPHGEQMRYRGEA